MNEAIVSRVYDIQVTSYEKALKNIQTLTAAFLKMDETKRKTDEQLKKAVEAGNVAAITKLSEKIKQLESDLKNLDKQRQVSAKEIEILARAERAEADAKLQNARSATEAAKAEEVRTRSIIAQEKELDRQIAQEQKANRQRQENAKFANAEAGSYYALLQAQRQTLEIYRQTGASNPLFEQVKKDAVEAKAKVDAFNRSLSPDGTLVGEYKTGILNAFRDLGLSDTLKQQRNDINNQLQQIIQKTKDLATQYRQAQTTGGAAFQTIENELRESIELQQRLENNLVQINNTLRNTDSIGNSVTNGISNGFRTLKNDVAAFALSYVGFQAAISGVQKVFDDTIALDSLNSALKVVSGNEQELAKNEEFLRDTTHRLGLEYVSTAQAFKGFFAAGTQAGLSADQTREIFEAATEASANLRLSQDATNGVLLAFGQIASKGKVQAEELRGQIGERLPGAFAVAARAMGVTQAQLNKMLETGQVTSNEFLPKFAAELKKTFGVDAQKEVTGLQATVNRFKNEFSEFLDRNSKSLSTFFTAIILLSSGVLGLISYLPQAIVLLGLYAAGWALANKQIVIQQAQLLLVNAQLIAGRIALVLFAAANGILNAVLFVTNGLVRAVTVAMNFFGVSMGSLPIKILLTLLGTLAAALVAMAAKVNNSSEAVRKHNAQLKIMADVEREAAKNIGDQISKLEALARVITSTAASYDTKRAALEELIKTDNRFSTALQGNVIDLNKLKAALKEVRDEIILNANAQAAAKLSGDKYADFQKIVAARQQFERSVANAKNDGSGLLKLDNINKEDAEFLASILDPSKTTLRAKQFGDGITIIARDYKNTLDQLKKAEGQALTNYTDYQDFSSDLQRQVLERTNAKLNAVKIPDFFERFKVLTTKGGKDSDYDQLKKDIDAKKATLNHLSTEYQSLAKLEEQIDDFLNPKKQRIKQPAASKLTAEQKDAFKDIDALLNAELAAENLRRARNEEGEEDYLRNILAINEKYINQKLALLKNRQTPEERRVYSELQLEKIKLEQDTSEKLLKIFSDRITSEKNLAQQEAQVRLNNTLDQPDLTATGKLKAQEEYYQKLLSLQIVFNSKQTSIEDVTGKRSIENERNRQQAIIDIVQKLNEIRMGQYAAFVSDIEQQTDRQLTSLSAKFDRYRQTVIDSGKSSNDKNAALNTIDKAQRIEEAAAKVQEALRIYNRAILDPTLDKSVVDAAFSAVTKAKKELDTATDDAKRKFTDLKSFLQNGLSTLFKFDQGSDNENLLGNVLASAFNTAQLAMNSYFDAEKQRIEQSKQATLERLDIELNQAKARAQSQAEEDSLDRQFQAKKEKAEKDAGERLKKVKKAEAKISLATELANIAAAAAANPLNGVTLGAAGIAMYSILAALAFARYALNVNNIETQQFAGSGKVKPVNLRTGKISTAQNIPTQSNGDNVLATVRVGEVILNKEHQRQLGGARTFAAIGVPGFADGGIVSPTFDFPFDAANRLQAPADLSFLNTSSSNNGNSLDIANLKDSVQAIAGSVVILGTTMKNLKVQVVAKEVQETNDKTKKASAVGTIG